MRLENDNRPEPLVERICEKCGKRFIPAVYHQYKVGYNHYFCSWSCYNHREIKYTETTGKRTAKPVTMYSKDGEVIEEFYSVNEVLQYLADMGLIVKPNSIREVCKGIRKTCYGYIFKYK